MLEGIEHNLDSCDWSQLDMLVAQREAERERLAFEAKLKQKEMKRMFRKARSKNCSICWKQLTETTCEWVKHFNKTKLFCPACYKEYSRGYM